MPFGKIRASCLYEIGSGRTYSQPPSVHSTIPRLQAITAPFYQMSKHNPLDKWLDSVESEIDRIRIRPRRIQLELLRKEIQQVESQAVDELGSDHTVAQIQRLELLKQDFASVEEWLMAQSQLNTTVREKQSWYEVHPDTDEALASMRVWLDKTQNEHKRRRQRHIAALRQFWPKADRMQRRRMVGLFGTYTIRLMKWSFHSQFLGKLTRIAQWSSKTMKKL